MHVLRLTLLAAATLSAAPVLAQHASTESSPTMHATAADTPATFVSLAEWSKRVEAEINERLRYPRSLAPHDPALARDGMVRVKFNCTPAGGTQNVALRKTSGSAAYDREALRVVRELVRMHPLPTGMTADQPYEAVIMFARAPSRSHDRLVRGTRDEIAQRTAWFKQDAPVTDPTM